MPAGAFRDLARFAGVHLYNDSSADDVFYINASYFTMQPASTGKRVVHFEREVDVYEGVTGQLVSSKIRDFSFDVDLGGVYIYRYE